MSKRKKPGRRRDAGAQSVSSGTERVPPQGAPEAPRSNHGKGGSNAPSQAAQRQGTAFMRNAGHPGAEQPRIASPATRPAPLAPVTPAHSPSATSSARDSTSTQSGAGVASQRAAADEVVVPGASPRLALHSAGRVVEVGTFTCLGLQHLEPQALGVTYWIDAAPDGDPYGVTVHISGRLRGDASSGGGDTFAVLASVDRVIPGSGRVAVTTRVPDLAPGTWDVVATPVRRAPDGSDAWVPAADPRLPIGRGSGTTVFEPVARVRAPGVRLGAWPALVAAGAVLALMVQILLAPRLGLSVQRLLPLSLAACGLGLLGAKVYYLATHPRERRSLLTSGMSVQGFVLVAIATVLVGAPLLGLSWTAVLDSMAPGLLLGMAVGRWGCLLGGCCAGRPTRSRWGVWSSNRRLGVRRVPVQLLESSLAGTLAALVLLGVLGLGLRGGGLLFVAGLAAYIAGRQLLFPLREIPRATSHGRLATLSVASVVLLGALTGLFVRMG